MKFICVSIVLVSALSLGVALAFGIAALVLDTPPWWIRMALVLWNLSSAVVDVTITICMTSLLLHAKASSCLKDTHDLLSRLIRIVLQTGLLTSILAILVVPLFLAELNGLYAIPWYILGKSYIISLLANLNARKRANAPLVHGTDINQPIGQPTKLSTVIFSPQNRRTGEGRNADSADISFPVHSIQTNHLQGRPVIKADTPEGSEKGETE